MSESDALDLIDQMKTKLGIQATMEEILADYHHVPEGSPFGSKIRDIKKKLGLRVLVQVFASTTRDIKKIH